MESHESLSCVGVDGKSGTGWHQWVCCELWMDGAEAMGKGMVLLLASRWMTRLAEKGKALRHLWHIVLGWSKDLKQDNACGYSPQWEGLGLCWIKRGKEKRHEIKAEAVYSPHDRLHASSSP